MKNEVRTGHLSHAPMARKDWGYLAVFLVVAALAGTWMGIELRKPFGIEWEGVLVHQESPIEIIVLKNGQKIVRNKREGFEVRIPGEWEASFYKANGVEKLRVGERGAQPAVLSEQPEGCIFDTFVTLNRDNLSVEGWIQRRGPDTILQRENISIAGRTGVRISAREVSDFEVAYLVVPAKVYEFVNYLPNDSACRKNFSEYLNTVQL